MVCCPTARLLLSPHCRWFELVCRCYVWILQVACVKKQLRADGCCVFQLGVPCQGSCHQLVACLWTKFVSVCGMEFSLLDVCVWWVVLWEGCCCFLVFGHLGVYISVLEERCWCVPYELSCHKADAALLQICRHLRVCFELLMYVLRVVLPQSWCCLASDL